ncbi:unnamed protein product [Callosobruchus maculatus]|uniref:LRRCT domain-containing protein n=1 Tax=Callosobruchus maculatus TaxID=64391 RepID=A0A653CAW4_CALMS|nr:unnamed protein product [Callosobruchus maculatus]
MKIAVFYWTVFLDILHSSTIARPSLLQHCTSENQLVKCQQKMPDFVDHTAIAFQLTGVKIKTFDLGKVVQAFPNVRNVSITDGNIVTLIPPKKLNSIKVLELRRLLLTNISKDFVRHFQNIEVLDLRENRLEQFPIEFFLGSVKELRLSNNSWNCSEDLGWILAIDKQVAVDIDELKCMGLPYPGKPLISIAQYVKELHDTCTTGCECSLSKVVQDLMTDELEPMITINCSYRGFTELPSNLPNNTRTLHLEGNSIASLEPLHSNPVYHSLWDLYLDDNDVTNIDELEGSFWLKHFREFSLKGNKLTKIPAYALDNALLKNPNMPKAVRLYLGGNPWRCDCVFIPVFQELVLQKYATQIRDIRDVKCSYVEGDENSLMPIIDLSRSSVCRLPPEYSLQEGLDLLNGILASLIVFILGKLAYDYYHFKKTGRLPWIVTKMP